MSLYGLDIIIDKNGQYHLIEINGICSGMGGFEKVYGDNRVKERVLQMLEEKYGKLTLNDGTYCRKRLKKEQMFRFLLWEVLKHIPGVLKKIHDPLNSLKSEKAHVDWINEDVKSGKDVEFPYEIYVGQESAVVNVYNEVLQHPLVNPFVAEEMTRNKFLSYMLLKDSGIKENIPKSALVGLGATDEACLEELLEKHDSFIMKPLLGRGGKGVVLLVKKEVEAWYRNSRGPVHKISPYRADYALLNKELNHEYFEDLVDVGYFRFEPGLALIQPFIESNSGNGYSSIRAIVCNGKFVDAYRRVAPIYKVNLCQGATAIFFHQDGFGEFCENVVSIFEKECLKYSPETFRKEIYLQYINERGRTSAMQRREDLKKVSNIKFVELSIAELLSGDFSKI